MTLFRGISQAILEDQAYTHYPEGFGYFGQGYIGESIVPFELEVITLVVLGGVSITGGKGNIFGVVLAVFLLGYLKFGMGLLNISAKVMIITTGALLIIAVLIPAMMDAVKDRNKLKNQKNSEVLL